MPLWVWQKQQRLSLPSEASIAACDWWARLSAASDMDYLLKSDSRMQTSDGQKKCEVEAAITRSLQVRWGEFIMPKANIQVSLRTETIHQVDCACKPVTCCLSVTKPVKGELIIPAGWFPEAPVAPGPLTAAWLFDGHLNYSGSWLIMGQLLDTLPRPAFVLPLPLPLPSQSGKGECHL